MGATKGSEAPQAAGRGWARGVLGWLGLAVVIVGAVVSSNLFSVRDDLFGSAVPKPALPVGSRDAFSVTPKGASAPTALRSAPWWQVVTTLAGTGSMTSSSFTIGGGASQWRVRASCPSGHLLVRVVGQSKALLDTACPSHATGYATQTGATRVEVTSGGPWRLEVAQEINVPLVEPPLPAMTSSGTSKVAVGSFYNVDQSATGHLTFYRGADGRFFLRLDHFFVSPNTDLQLLLSALKAPHSSSVVAGGSLKLVATMDVTAGSLNYVVPAGVDPTRFKSLVVWCPATSSAYAAASLVAVR
ncbi:MAG: DM13 domain-containing protein [Actinomycetota bacterium]|nr:DM13 domain-containing protein [Actinomycetota bacterium]